VITRIFGEKNKSWRSSLYSLLLCRIESSLVGSK
jgi:hypothetical protein